MPNTYTFTVPLNQSKCPTHTLSFFHSIKQNIIITMLWHFHLKFIFFPSIKHMFSDFTVKTNCMKNDDTKVLNTWWCLSIFSKSCNSYSIISTFNNQKLWYLCHYENTVLRSCMFVTRPVTRTSDYNFIYTWRSHLHCQLIEHRFWTDPQASVHSVLFAPKWCHLFDLSPHTSKPNRTGDKKKTTKTLNYRLLKLCNNFPYRIQWIRQRQICESTIASNLRRNLDRKTRL